jgi:predicted RNA-binding protein
MNSELCESVRSNVQSITKQTCEEWGGVWRGGGSEVTELPLSTEYSERTVVRSHRDALDAFEKYEEYFQYVLDNYESTSSSTVLVPCGAMKPIGSSASHAKKLDAIKKAGLGHLDLNIMSEPCTIVPHEHRLKMAPVNYDFPPEYTERGSHEEVFNLFADRIAEWIDTMDYTTIFAYLVKRHQNKLDAAVERANSDVEIVEIPGASYNPETAAYSGDQFKSTEHITDKIIAAKELLYSEGEGDLSKIPESTAEFYSERWSF